MEDMATGEIRLSILWEWLHKGAVLTEGDPETGTKAGAVFTQELYNWLATEEYQKLLAAASKDIYETSKSTTLPIALEIANVYVLSAVKPPWFIDLLNINLNNLDLAKAKKRIRLYLDILTQENTRITENLDFIPVGRLA
ncbi:malate synthase, partial [Larkinella bovis]